MLITLSPAKTLDFEKQKLTKRHSQPAFLDESQQLIDSLRKFSPKKIATLMGVSSDLAELNHERFADWQTPFTMANAKQAVLAFRGDVFVGLDADSFSADDFQTVQKSVRILSGLYGVLKPLDLIQAYRLEMGTKLATRAGKNLYEFWGTKIVDSLNDDLKKQKDAVLINLASNEYFKSVKPKQIEARIVTPTFKEDKNGTYKLISFFAKKARGQMARYIVQNRISDVEEIKSFDIDGYRFNAGISSENELFFTRKSKTA